jgi:hypothetical protein
MNFTESGRILLRRSAKNILFSGVNTYWYSNTVNTGSGRFEVDRSKISTGESPFGWWWIWGILPASLLFVGGIVCILFFVFFFERKQKNTVQFAADVGGGSGEATVQTDGGDSAQADAGTMEAISEAPQNQDTEADEKMSAADGNPSDSES